MKHFSKVFVALLLSVMLLMPYAVAFAEDGQDAGSASIEIAKGKSVTVSPEITEAHINEKPKTTEWTSSDETVATVSGGKISAKSAGTATITCSMEFEDSTEETTWEVNVFVPVASIKTSKTLEVTVGDEPAELAVEIAPEDATYKDLEWSSSDEEVVKVDDSGIVTAVKAGKAVLTATANDPGNDKKVSAAISVTVLQPVLSLGLDQSTVELAKGKSVTLAAEMTPEDASNKQLTWTSSDPAVAAVDSKGKVTAKGLGNATITCEAADGAGASVSCEVEVFVPVAAVKSDAKTISVNTEETTEPVSITIDPEDAKYKDVTWSTADETIATVSEDGRITGVKAGKTKITATSADVIGENEKAKLIAFDVTVLQPVLSLGLDQSTVELAKGKSVTLAAEMTPEDASNKQLTWTSSDPAVAAVDSKGKVTAKGLGNATITCEAADGAGASVSCEVEVFVPVAAVKSDAKTISVNTEETTEPVSITIDPEDAKYKDVTWSTADETIATVSEDGRITGVKAGKTKITATSADVIGENEKAKLFAFDVTVLQPVKSINLDKTSVNIAKGSSQKLVPEVLPQDASNKKLVWKSSNESVATVSNGSVSAKGVGKATITCTSEDGSGASASCEVTVYQAVKSIKLLVKSDLSVTTGKNVTIKAEAQPNDATNKKLRYESENNWIASVDDNGVVTGKNTGSCVIYIYSTDGSDVKSKVRVYVEPKISIDVVSVLRQGYFGIYDTLVVNFKNLNTRRAIERVDMDVYLYNGSTLINAYSVWTEKKISGKSSLKQKWTLGYLNLMRTNSVVIRLTKITYTDGTKDTYPDEPIIF